MTERTLSVLIIEDVEDDALLLVRELRKAGYELSYRRVETALAMREALEGAHWDVILSDYHLPTFDAPSALEVLREYDVDIPFIIVSGTIGEETAVAAMKQGAHDYLLKGALARLIPAIERELGDQRARAERRRASSALEESLEALRRSERRFRSVVSSIDAFVFTLDETGRYTGVYGRFLRRERLEPGRFLGKTIGEVLGDEIAIRHAEACRRSVSGEPIVYDWSMSGPDGLREFQTVLAPLEAESQGPPAFVGVAQEMTEQRRLHAQLLVSDRMASVGTLATGVAHEINNPLAVVLANLEFVRYELDMLKARLIGKKYDSPGGLEELLRDFEEPLDEAKEAADRVRVIVRDLKIFGRSGDDEVRAAVDIRRVLDSSARMAWNEIRHRAHLVKDYDVVPPVDGNESRLGQIFLNLIVNAAHAIPEGRARGNEIRLGIRQADDGVVVEVADSGAGIPPEHMSRIFEPFFTTKPVGVGTGLGLAICDGLVRGLGGSIEVESEVGKGTTFRVKLKVASSIPCPPILRGQVVRPATRRGRVLVVDDEPMLASAIGRALGSEHEVEILSDARMALRMLQEGERFDVILCDLMMPDFTGMDFYTALRRGSPSLADRIVFFTGGTFTMQARNFIEQVPNLRLDKPFDMQHLRAIVNDRIR